MRFSVSCAVLVLAAVAWNAPLCAQIIGELTANDANVAGAVMLADGGTRVMSGSAIRSGESAAVLRLSRGGEVRVCPHSSVSLNAGSSSWNLTLGMSTGAIETHYTLTNSADTILTPDFRILLAGPGSFHFAISSDAKGNTCVRSLAGNTSSVLVSETMGDGVYQVRAGDGVVFHEGRVAKSDPLVPPDCGCAAPPEPVLRAGPFTQSLPETSPPVQPAPMKLARSEAVRIAPLLAPLTPPPVTNVSPAIPPNEVHVSFEAPFVFRAREPVMSMPAVTRVTFEEIPSLPIPEPVLRTSNEPPATLPREAKPKGRGIFRRIGGFFAAIFR